MLTIKGVTVMLMLIGLCPKVSAQENEPVFITTESDTIRPSKYIEEIIEKPKLDFFQGFTLSADVFGPIQYLMSDYGSAEAALRLNLKNSWFPIVEVGYARCKTQNSETDIAYSTNAPYFRVGIDANILKDKYQDNRLFVGARYGFSSFKFDISAPAVTDPIWGGSAPVAYKDASSTSGWMEIVIGVQVKIWKKFHMGWSVRYKQEMSIGQPRYAKPYYVPGYGTTVDTSCWGGTYNLIFDLNWGKKPRQDNSSKQK